MNVFSGSNADPELRLTPANASETQKWTLDDKGRIISQSKGYAVSRDGPVGVNLKAPSDADGQKFTIGSDNTTMISGFVLRTKLKPELNLVMQIYPSDNQIRLAVYNGSDEQRWVLTPAGYLVSCKTINGLKLLVKAPGKFHALCVDHASYCRFNRLVHFITQE